MATSGSVNFSLTRENIIKRTLELLGVLGPGQSITSEDKSLVSDYLNMMVKSWHADGFHLWTLQEATVFFASDDVDYDLNSSSGDHASNTVSETTLSADEAAAQTILSVTSSSGMTAADAVGIELDDGTLEWTTIATVDSATQITVDDALSSGASSGNAVYAYTTKMGRPEDIYSARLRDQDGKDRQLRRLARDEYFNLPNKTTEATPVAWYYDPQLSTGVLYVWPEPDDVGERLKITYARSIEDFDADNDDPDFPQEWLETIIYNLAVAVAPVYGKEQKIQALILPRASLLKERMLNYDNDKTSLYMSPGI